MRPSVLLLSLAALVACEPPDVVWTAPGTYVDFDVGYSEVCAVDSDQQLRCFGDLTAGPPPSGRYADVELGTLYGCAVTVDGAAECWGPGTGAGETAEHSGEVFTEVYADGDRTCFRATDGTLRCNGDDWPQNTSLRDVAHSWGTLDPVSCGLDDDDGLVCWGGRGALQGEAGWDDWWAPEGGFSDVSVGVGSICAIGKSGGRECWHWDPDRPGSDQSEYNALAWEQVSTGANFDCALHTEGWVTCRGAPSPVIPLVQIDSDFSLTCGLNEGGKLNCWSDTGWLPF